MSNREDIMKTMSSSLMPGNPNRPPVIGPSTARIREAENETPRDPPPSMATPQHPGSLRGPAPKEISIAQSVCIFTEEVVKFLETEADRVLAEARNYHDKLYQKADRIRRTGMGGI